MPCSIKSAFITLIGVCFKLLCLINSRSLSGSSFSIPMTSKYFFIDGRAESINAFGSL